MPGTEAPPANPLVHRLLRIPLLAALCAAAAASAGSAQQAARPNFVVILADDLGYGDLGAYGAADLRTPNLDNLAAAGMRFSSFYANSSVCSPTRAALLSGRYPDLVGVPGVIRTRASNSWGHLSPDVRLLPGVLRGAGYHTAIVGKWHLGLESPNRPWERGFDESYAFLGDMMDSYTTHRREGLNYLRRNGVEIDPAGHATDLFTRAAVEYIRSRRATEAPFFLYLAYNAPHVPIQPPEAWVDRVKARQPGLDEQRTRIAALIEQMDDGVGQVLRALREAGQADNTLVVFTSDNGGEVPAGAHNGALRGTKTELYEGGIRVPGFAAWPGHIRSGQRSDAVLLTMDVFPTVAEAAGVELDARLNGRSFLPLLLGQGAAPAERTLFWVRREGGREMGLPIYAVRRGAWKLLQNRPGTAFELYDLQSDPREAHDLAAERRDVFDALAAALRAHVQQTGPVPWQEPR